MSKRKRSDVNFALEAARTAHNQFDDFQACYYAFSEDGLVARICNWAGESIDARSVGDWAELGAQLKAALSGLEFLSKSVTRTTYRHVFAQVDFLNGEAVLTTGGALISAEELKQSLCGRFEVVSVTIGDTAPSTIAAWAKVGEAARAIKELLPVC